ncbi:peptidoglycan-binding domain-containing protein [Bradyrhizobium sp. McL0616]|uniref:peptidoglycan-binding domain-containing protein n=1 Tax=Bradyrhizobium sp. McL0616 TaxID=3415674 RepID=UPI003CE7434D
MAVPPTISSGSPDVGTVVAAQRNLNVADAREASAGRPGLNACPLTEDGVFGTEVTQATIEFQTRRGLVPDGIIGPLTWGQLLESVNPDSGVRSGTSLPIEGAVRWSVGLDDIATVAGQAPTDAQLSGLLVTVGGSAARDVTISPDGRIIYFTVPAGEEGAADLVLTGGDASSFVLANAVSYTASFGAALQGVIVAVALSIQEAGSFAAALQVGRIQSFVDDVAAAMRDHQNLLAKLLTRLQDPLFADSVEDADAWFGYMSSRARMVAAIVNEQCRITLSTDPIADLDGLPFGGADDQPTLDTGATVLLLTAMESVIVPGFVDLTA